MSTAVQPSPSNQSFLSRRNNGRNNQPNWRAFYANGYPSEVIVISDDEDNTHENSNYRIDSGQILNQYNQEIPQPPSHQHHHNDSSSSSSTSSSLSTTTAMTSTTAASSVVNDNIKYLKSSSGKQPMITLPDSSKRLRKYSSSGTFSDQIHNIIDLEENDSHHDHHHHNHYYNDYQNDAPVPPFDDYDEDDSPYYTEYSMIESTESINGGSINIAAPAAVPLTATARSSLTRTSSSIASNGLLTSNSKKKRKRVNSSRKHPPAATYLDDISHQQYPSHLILTPPPPPPPPQPLQVIKPTDVEVRPIIDRVRNLDVSDDKDGHFIVKTNTFFADNRYQIIKLLGQGTFGKVVAVYDKKTKTHRAIKIIRAVEKYREASRIELRVLMTLAMYDEQNIHQCIHLRDCFDYRNHICIVTDLLGISIFDFMKANSFLPFPGSHVQSFAYQLLKSVSFLHGLNLVHTDLKPENILLTTSEATSMPYRKGRSSVKKRNILNSTTINLIDFGSAIFNDEHHSSVVSTRHYRAPEIILSVGWSFPCDIWSIGCILVELCTGEALFQTHDNLEHLALMEKVIGEKLDPNVIQRIPNKSPARTDFINRYTNTINYPNSDIEPGSIKYVNSVRTFDQLIQYSVPYYARDKAFWTSFLDLLHKIFVYDANKRITAREALNHPWFQKVINDDGSNSHLQHREEYQSTTTQSYSTRSYNRHQRL